MSNVCGTAARARGSWSARACPAMERAARHRLKPRRRKVPWRIPVCVGVILGGQTAVVEADVPKSSRSAPGHDDERTWDGFVDLDLFRKQGYLLIPAYASRRQVDAIRAEVGAMVDAWDGPMVGSQLNASLSMRVGGASSSSAADHNFFLESATKTSFFLERSALDEDNPSKLRSGVTKREAIRKLGHGLHLAAGVSSIRSLLQSSNLVHLTAALGWRAPVVAQTLYRFAPAFAAGVDRHQDSTFLYTQPPSCLGLWLALQDADERNGCLRIREGSHVEPIRERLVRRARVEAGSTAIQLHFHRLSSRSNATEADFTAVPVSRGDLLVMHGSLEHYSAPGVSPGQSRESLQVHLVESSAQWPADNWIQYPDGMEFMRLQSSADGRERSTSEL